VDGRESTALSHVQQENLVQIVLMIVTATMGLPVTLWTGSASVSLGIMAIGAKNIVLRGILEKIVMKLVSVNLKTTSVIQH